MAKEFIVYTKPVIDSDDKLAEVSVPAGGAETKLVFEDGATFFTTRTGRRARLVHLGNAVAAGGEANITFHLKINGARASKRPYDKFTQALGETYNGWAILSTPIDLPQNALIEVTAENADGATAYAAYIRMRVEYEEL